MRNKSGNSVLLRRAVTAALAAVGIKEDQIKFNGHRIEVPVSGITVFPALEEGRRIWKAESEYSVMRMEDAFETPVKNILFTVPLEDDLLLARKLATQVAVSRVDAALDSIILEAAGRLQR